MRKFLIILLIGILMFTLIFTALKGLKIGNIEIAPIAKISEENKNLDKQIADLNSAISDKYVTKKSNLEASLKKLEETKKEFQKAITYNTEEEIKRANQTEKYKIDFLWTKIGMYATKNKIVMQANVSEGSAAGLYNISFTAIGEYLGISEFIYAIENDSNLGFTIEEFSLAPYTGTQETENANNLQASFTIRNIPIDSESLF